jgi:signal transduction histidine kinase
MAEELLKLYAERKLVKGYTFSGDTPWQQEFESAFPYELTPDQVTAIADVTAIAIQNARIHEATDRALTRRVKVLTGLNDALSYDLKNLVNAMVGHAGLLNSYQVEGEPAEIIAQLVEAGNQTNYLLDQMLELITLNQDLVISQTPVNLADVVKRAVRDMLRPAEAKRIEMKLEQTGTPYRIQGEAPHLYRSVLNLLDNAIKFSPEGAPVQIALSFQENCVQIKVRDVGPGIPEEDLPHLFTRGFRNRQPDSEQPGLGLGLELVRATAEAHRGSVTAHNADGGGAEFVVTFSSALRVS